MKTACTFSHSFDFIEQSSKNEVSIEFHKKNGFKECGRFSKIGKKHGEEFDVVWVQRFI